MTVRVHLETNPKQHGFVKDLRRPSERRRLAEVLSNQLYELDWAAVYTKDGQYMFYTMDDLIKALQYDKYDYGSAMGAKS